MSKRSITVIKRSFLPLAPLATLAMGGCSVLGLSHHHEINTRNWPAWRPNLLNTTSAVQPAAPKDDINPDAEKNILAFADRLAKAEKSDHDSQAQVVLASDQHLPWPCYSTMAIRSRIALPPATGSEGTVLNRLP